MSHVKTAVARYYLHSVPCIGAGEQPIQWHLINNLRNDLAVPLSSAGAAARSPGALSNTLSSPPHTPKPRPAQKPVAEKGTPDGAKGGGWATSMEGRVVNLELGVCKRHEPFWATLVRSPS